MIVMCGSFAGGSERDKSFEIDDYCLLKFKAERRIHQTVHDMDIRKWAEQMSVEVRICVYILGRELYKCEEDEF